MEDNRSLSAQAYQAQINLHGASPSLSQNGHSRVSVDDVHRIGVQIKSGLIIHMWLLPKCPYLGDMLHADMLSP